jgi:hypothetical protein
MFSVRLMQMRNSCRPFQGGARDVHSKADDACEETILTADETVSGLPRRRTETIFSHN